MKSGEHLQSREKGGLAPIEDADAAVADAVAPYRETPIVKTISFVSKLSDQPPLRALCVAAFAAGAVTGSPRLRHSAIHMLAAHTVATFAKDFVKHRIDRRRPNARRVGADYRLAAGHRSAKEDTSFPSGHSAGAIAVAAAYARHFPEHRGVALAAGVGLSVAQISRGSHYPSDVAAGWVIGAASEMLLDRLLTLTRLGHNAAPGPPSLAE